MERSEFFALPDVVDDQPFEPKKRYAEEAIGERPKADDSPHEPSENFY